MERIQRTTNHGYEPQSKLWKQIPQRAAGYHTLRCAGLFNLPIPLRLRNWSFTIKEFREEAGIFLPVLHKLLSWKKLIIILAVDIMCARR